METNYNINFMAKQTRLLAFKSVEINEEFLKIILLYCGDEAFQELHNRVNNLIDNEVLAWGNQVKLNILIKEIRKKDCDIKSVLERIKS